MLKNFFQKLSRKPTPCKVEPSAIETPHRYLYWGDKQALVEVHYDAHLILNLNDVHIVPSIIKTGWWEPWLDHLLHSFVHPGDVVVDVGSNFGYFTNLLAKLVEHYGRVFAFECNPQLIPLLRHSLYFNGFSTRVSLYQAAALDEAGTADILYYPAISLVSHVQQETERIQSQEAANGLIPWNDQAGDTVKVSVPTVTLDMTVGASTKEIKLLHMDAEGCDPLIILGAKELIARSRDLKIICEWSNHDIHAKNLSDFYQKRKESVEFLLSQKFKFYKIEVPQKDVFSTPPELTLVKGEDIFNLENCDLVIHR